MCVPEVLTAEAGAREDLPVAPSPPNTQKRINVINMWPVLQAWVGWCARHAIEGNDMIQFEG